MFPAELFLLMVHLLQLNCILPLGVPKYLLSTGSISDATKEKEKADGEGVREEGREERKKGMIKGERRDNESIRGRTNPYSVRGWVSAICCLALLEALFSA